AHGSDRMNERGRVGYQGPCPPEGRVHTYRFTLYALNVDRLPLDTSRSPTRQEVERAMVGKVLAQTTLHARFGR
ncbi:MAG: YbhB/YbcL family Raf kinase inhibitor-like protein, partial [Aquificaceae bacterium]|nr:YbhB/YbcL family Raf kinase inhibitor-like protein [Aquificaceae bacterium]